MEGFLGSAIFFLIGLFALPWLLAFGLGFLAPLIGIGGSILLYILLGTQVVFAIFSWNWHEAMSIGLSIATVLKLVSMFVVPVPFF